MKEWTADGKRWYRYVCHAPIFNFWAVLSARYQVAREQAGLVTLEVHHHPEHGTNVPRMIEAMRDALSYASAEFGRYQHEVARQWWGHQVLGPRMQGSTMLVESMAQYTALMVLEKEYGRKAMRRFLKNERDNYLRGRGEEGVGELPLMRVEEYSRTRTNLRGSDDPLAFHGAPAGPPPSLDHFAPYRICPAIPAPCAG